MSDKTPKTYTHIFQGEPFPWQTGDPFWDGFKLTYEIRPSDHGYAETIFHMTAATQAQKDRFIELMYQAPDALEDSTPI